MGSTITTAPIATSGAHRRCTHTGLTKPECHCAPCLRELVDRHRRP
jgi:hypothetical protein